MAASKVNKNFVVLLVTIIAALVFGAGGFAYYAILQGGARNVARGDAAMEKGDYELAAKYYSRAVNKDRSRVDWTKKWIGALVKWTPTNETDYQKAYKNYYLGALKGVAQVQNKDPDAATAFLSEVDGYMRKGNNNAEALRSFSRDVDDTLRTLPQDDPRTKKLIRYRGLAQLDVASLITVPDEDRNKALTDLQSVWDLDKSDWEVGLGIMRWYLLDADLKARARRDTDADNARKKAREQIETMLKPDPTQPEAICSGLIVRQAQDSSKAATLADRVKLLEQYKPMATEVFDKLDKVDPKQLRTETMWQVVTRIRPLLAKEGATRCLKLVDAALAANPDQPEMMIIGAEMAYEAGDMQETLKRFQQVADLKDRPVSRVGMMIPHFRRSAVGRQVDTALDMWRRAKEAPAKEAAMKLAKDYRDKLKSLVDVQSESDLKLRNAYIDIAEGRLDASIRTLNELAGTAASSSDHRVLLPLAEALDRVGNTGDALATYERLIKAGYIDSGVYGAASVLCRKLLNFEKAYEYAEQARTLDPDNAGLEDMVKGLREALKAKRGDIKDISDPIMQALLKARELSKDGDNKAARAAFEDLYKRFPKEPRVIQQYVTFLVNDDNRVKATEVLDKAIADSPSEKRWQQMKTVVQIANPDEALLALIDQSDASAVAKLTQKYQIYARMNKPDKMEEVYQEAVKVAPDDPGVIDMGFLRALAAIATSRGPANAEKRAAAEADAQKIIAKATERNLDELGGLLYRGRLLIAQEKYKDGAVVFKQAVEKVSTNPTAWRLLGLCYTESGQVNEGLEAYRRAIEGRPNDGSIAKDYARALLRVNQAKIALDLVNPDTGVLRFPENANDDELIDIWLTLEAQAGGNDGIAKAIQRRRLILTRTPDNLSNAVSLVRLLTGSGQFEESKRVLDQLSKNPKMVKELHTRLQADWYAAQGDIDGGDKVYSDFIASLGEKVSVRRFLEYSEWLLDYNRPEKAMLKMQEARKYQTKLHEADRTLGDFLFNGYGKLRDNADKARAAGQKEQADQSDERAKLFLNGAAEAYAAIVDDNADDAAQGFPVMKRLCETQIRLEKFEDATKTLDRMTAAATGVKLEDDMQMMLLRGTIVEKKGDPRGARKIYDKAVELFPGDARPYMARAILSSKDEAQFPDTIADLSQVVRMQPSNAIAWNMMFVLHDRKGMVDQALTLLNNALDKNPGNDDLNILAIDKLRSMGRNDEALALILKLVSKEKKNDPRWMRDAATFAAGEQKWREAADLFKSLREMPGQDSVELKRLHLHCLLMRLNPLPEKSVVGALLRDIEADKSADQDSLAMLMLRARAEAYLGDTDKGMSLAKQGLNKAEGSIQVYGWQVDATNMILAAFKKGNQFFRDMPDSVIQARREMFSRFRDARKPTPPILRILEMPFRQKDGEPLAKLLDEVNKMEGDVAEDKPAKIELYRIKNQLQYAMGKYEDALESCKQGLALAPNEVEFNNNAAYTLAKHLNKPEEALPYGDNAVRNKPRQSAVLDTVGQIYAQLSASEKDKKKSQDYFDRALRLLTNAVDFASDPGESVAANVHLGLLRMSQTPPDIGAARKCSERANEAYKKLKDYEQKPYKEDLESLSKRVQ